MRPERINKADTWFRMLSHAEKIEAFMELAERMYELEEIFIPDNHTSADLISGGMGDVDAIAPLWETSGEPILKVGR